MNPDFSELHKFFESQYPAAKTMIKNLLMKNMGTWARAIFSPA